MDRRDIAPVASCFTPDAGYDGARGRSTLHFLGNQTIDLANDTARSETYALARHVLADGRHRLVAVRSCDELVRAGGAWRICRRVVHRERERTDASAPP